MIERAKVVEAAREWLDVPYQKDQCLYGVAADCVCLTRSAFEAAGAELPRQAQTLQLAGGIGPNYLIPLFESCGFHKTDNPLPGDVIIWDYVGHPHHTGIVTSTDPIFVIHASDCYSKVHEHVLIGQWISRFRCYLTHPLLK